MDVEVNRQSLVAALGWTQNIVERRHLMPIISNALFEAHDGKIRLTATDMEVGVRSYIKGDVKVDGRITLGAKKLHDFAQNSLTDTVRLIQLDSNYVEVRSGRACYKIVGLSADEFPTFPEFDASLLAYVPSTVLSSMIHRTIFSASTDPTRQEFNGVCLESGDNDALSMIATDTRRIALETQQIGNIGLREAVILPRKGVTELQRLLEQSGETIASIGFIDNMMFAIKDDVELFMRLIDGKFPNVRAAIPADSPLTAIVDCAEFIRCLRRLTILISEENNVVRMEFSDGLLRMLSRNPSLGEAVEEIEIKYVGDPLVVGFNPRHILDVLEMLDGGPIMLSMGEGLRPVLVSKSDAPGYIYAMMPMRLS